jgi:UDP-N-acetylmuramoyl-L-alanyl-D-glutamate--2,6-diaminopimelate ligase
MAGRGDIVVIAGKGHEATQEVAGVHYPFNDVDVAKSTLSHKKGSEL